jgi:hypothetical protein
MFTRPEDVVPDEERPGLLRAQHAGETDTGDVHVCTFHDLSETGTVEPGLEAAGFETIDLSGNAPLQRALDQVRAMDCITDEVAAAIRDSLTGARFDLENGTSLKIDLVVDDGLFHRRAGPNWHDVNPGGIDGINGHGGASYVHGDQDVFGTPLRQLMHGAAPDMFRHNTPDGRNDEATTFLLNMWIPLHAPVQPLALMDRRTLDAKKHQLRYGLPVDGFLDRDDDAAVNDIWNFLHNDEQAWYIRSNMESDQGYLFDTLGTPHGAGILPGEPALEELSLALGALDDAFGRGDTGAVESIAADQGQRQSPTEATPEIQQAWQRMSDLVDAATAVLADPVGEPGVADWCTQASAASGAVIRKSVELRLVASVISD